MDVHLGQAYLRAAYHLITDFDHSHNDVFMDRVLDRTVFSFRTNRRIFRGMIRLADHEEGDPLAFLFEQAAREAAPAAEQSFSGGRRLYSVRMPEARAVEFAERLEQLADEFAASGGEGPVFGFAGAVYRTSIPGGRS